MSTLDDQVQAFYERWPFPRRDPQDERRRLIWGPMGLLGLIDTRCFGGQRTYDSRFRLLVAGCGTGDGAILFAEQLQAFGATVTALDLSKAALEVTRARAEVRGLKNLELHQGSLLNLPESGWAPFDYVHCGGVLHHLEDPAEGLAALTKVLAPGGAMGLMIYGRYGRAGIDTVRALMARALPKELDPHTRALAAVELLESLPEGHLFERIAQLADEREYDLGAVADMFLHPRERNFTVRELHAWLGGAGLAWRAWIERREAYLPRAYLQDMQRLAEIETMPLEEQQQIGELLSGSLAKHSFFANRPGEGPGPARLSANMVPRLWRPGFREGLLGALRRGDTAELVEGDLRLRIDPEPEAVALLSAIDGKHSVGEIVGADPRLKVKLEGLIELLDVGNHVWLRSAGLRQLDVPG